MTDAKINALVKVRDGFRMASDAIDEYLETLGPKTATLCTRIFRQRLKSSKT